MAHYLAARANEDIPTVLLKALKLYEMALDAQAKGQRFAVLTTDDEIVHEVIGIGA